MKFNKLYEQVINEDKKEKAFNKLNEAMSQKDFAEEFADWVPGAEYNMEDEWDDIKDTLENYGIDDSDSPEDIEVIVNNLSKNDFKKLYKDVSDWF
jgi:hypothetical protein